MNDEPSEPEMEPLQFREGTPEDLKQARELYEMLEHLRKASSIAQLSGMSPADFLLEVIECWNDPRDDDLRISNLLRLGDLYQVMERWPDVDREIRETLGEEEKQ